MQEELLSPDYAMMTKLFAFRSKRSSNRLLLDGIVATVWTFFLGIPLYAVFLLLIYYELYFHGVQATFSFFHVLGEIVPIHLATLLLWSAIFWTAVYAIRRFLSQKKQLANTQERLEYSHTQALTDELTGIWNRRGFEILLQIGLEQARNSEQSYTLLLADINQFKQYNDTYGHLAGDQVLKQVAHTLAGCIRKEDAVARYGGDEFAILCPGLNWNDAIALVQRLHEACKKNTPQTLTIGASLMPLDGNSRDILIETADRRLYQGKNR